MTKRDKIIENLADLLAVTKNTVGFSSKTNAENIISQLEDMGMHVVKVDSYGNLELETE